MTLVLSAFGAFFAVQLIKAVWPKRLHPLAKMLLCLGVVALITQISLPKHHTFSELAIYSLAGAGIAISIHRVVRLAINGGDFWAKRVIQIHAQQGRPRA